MDVDDWIVVAQPLMAHEAHLIRTRLEADGIKVFLRGETIASFTGVPNEFTTDWSNPLGGVAVQVPLHQADRARRILQEIKNAPRDDYEDEKWVEIKPNFAVQFVRGLIQGGAVWCMTWWVFGMTSNWTAGFSQERLH